MKYSMKLSLEQAISLRDILCERINQEPADMLESWKRDMLIAVYKKIRNKLEAFPAKGYGVSLNAPEAKGFYQYWFGETLPPNWIYEANIINSRLAEIEKLYA